MEISLEECRYYTRPHLLILCLEGHVNNLDVYEFADG